MNTSASTLPKTGPIARIVNEVLAAANSSFSDALNVVLILAGVLLLLSAVVARPWCGGRALPPAATSDAGATNEPLRHRTCIIGQPAPQRRSGTLGRDGESVGWPRPGFDPVEEGRDSAGQGAG